MAINQTAVDELSEAIAHLELFALCEIICFSGRTLTRFHSQFAPTMVVGRNGVTLIQPSHYMSLINTNEGLGMSC